MFEGILFKTILEQAIAAEERAYRYYQQIAEKPEMKGAADLLTYLAGEELLHRIKLEELQREGSAGKMLLKNIEIPEEPPPISKKERRDVPLQEKRETVQTVLHAAFEKEKNAYSRYSSIGNSLSGKKQEGLFRLLANEEKKHMDLIAEYLKNTDSYADS